MFKLKINKDYMCIGHDIHKKSTIELKEGVTVLVGCNGSGKSTLIRQIIDYVKQNEIPYIYYDNLVDGGANAKDRAGNLEDFGTLATLLTSSEGEEIIENVGNFIFDVGKFCSGHKNDKDIFILLDAFDSGLSIDNIDELKSVFNLIIKDNKNTNVYIIVAANTYEVARNEQCFDVNTCEYIEFANYSEYRKFVLKSRQKKEYRKRKEL